MKKTILTILALALSAMALDVNSSPIKDIQDSVPGIGPKIGANLEAYRKEQKILTCDDLQNVKGIGVKKAAVACPLLHLSFHGRAMPESLARGKKKHHFDDLSDRPQAKRTSHAKSGHKKHK